AEGFAAAIGRTLVSQTPEDAERRVDVARANSWQTRIAEMWALVDEVVRRKSQEAGRWDVRLRRAYRTAQRRAVGALVALAAAYLLVFETPLVWWLASPLELRQPPRAADAIVVFAG